MESPAVVARSLTVRTTHVAEITPACQRMLKARVSTNKFVDMVV